MLWVDISNFSWRRDSYFGRVQDTPGDLDNLENLIAFVNQLNDNWIKGARRMSPELLQTLPRTAGEQFSDCVRTLDIEATPTSRPALPPNSSFLGNQEESGQSKTETWAGNLHQVIHDRFDIDSDNRLYLCLDSIDILRNTTLSTTWWSYIIGRVNHARCDSYRGSHVACGDGGICIYRRRNRRSRHREYVQFVHDQIIAAYDPDQDSVLFDDDDTQTAVGHPDTYTLGDAISAGFYGNTSNAREDGKPGVTPSLSPGPKVLKNGEVVEGSSIGDFNQAFGQAGQNCSQLS